MNRSHSHHQEPSSVFAYRIWFGLASILTVAFLVMLVSSLSAQTAPQPKHLISAAALKSSLQNADQRVIDVRNSVTDYWAGHIPGAVYVHPESLRWPRGGTPIAVMPAEALALYLGELGIAPDTNVIIYGEDNMSSAAYFLAAALENLGHEVYAVLEGGFAAWRINDGPVSMEYPRIEPALYPIVHSAKVSAYASEADVKKALADGDAVVIDARSIDEYTGEAGDLPRRGHIAGAGHVAPGKLTGEDGNWKSLGDIQAAFRAAGAAEGKPVIVYCNSGRSSAQAWFALKNVAGHENVQIYNGSFNEWVSNPDNPVATGQPPTVTPVAVAASGELKVGDPAPGFTLKDQNGNDVSLADYKGKWVVLYFYPKADTAGCTKEACSFSDNLLHFSESGATIIGVSGDTVEDQKAFANKYDLQITLLADPANHMMAAYGVAGEPSQWQGRPFVFARRATFLIDPEGRIAHIWPKVNVTGHTEEVQAKLAELKN